MFCSTCGSNEYNVNDIGNYPPIHFLVILAMALIGFSLFNQLQDLDDRDPSLEYRKAASASIVK